MSKIPPVPLLALTEAAREENRSAARKIGACYDFHLICVDREAKLHEYSRYGTTEMALALGCSATVAESYVAAGIALKTRMPLLRKAFEEGDIDLARVRTSCRILDNLNDDILGRVEDEVVEAAHRLSAGPLETAIWAILLRAAPEEAAALREFAKKFRSIRYRKGGELARIQAELTAPEAAAAWQLLGEMADTLCKADPRSGSERLCDAFMARMYGEARLTCQCGSEDCPKADAQLPGRRVPLTMVTVDIATLIGLLANPAYLAGHGAIDPELAQELARNSQWQVLLTEAVTLAEHLGLATQNPDTGDWEKREQEDGEPGVGEAAAGEAGAEDAGDPGAREPEAGVKEAEPAAAKSGNAESSRGSGTPEPAPQHRPTSAQCPDNRSEAKARTETESQSGSESNTGTGTGSKSKSKSKSEPGPSRASDRQPGTAATPTADTAWKADTVAAPPENPPPPEDRSKAKSNLARHNHPQHSVVGDGARCCLLLPCSAPTPRWVGAHDTVLR